MSAEIGAERVGMRLSPASYFGDMLHVAGDEDAYVHLLKALGARSIAYTRTAVVSDLIYESLGGGRPISCDGTIAAR